MKTVKHILPAVILSIFFILSGCNSADLTSKENLTLKIGLMPAVDSAPIFIAEKNGYFKELGLNMDIQVYTNAVNRQSALQSGELDGAMTDLVAFLTNVQNGFDIKITTSTDGSFPFLVRKDFEEKKKVKVGTMEVSVTNYMTDESLGDKYEMEKVFISEIPARLEMIKAGQLDMANIPEPIASMGELSGLTKRVYENKDEFMPEAIVFTGKAIKEKEKAIKLFHEAYDKAVDDILKDENTAREILIEKLELKPEIKDKIALPKYNHTRVPDEAYINKIKNWIEKVLKTEIKVEYDAMVERKFIKK